MYKFNSQIQLSINIHENNQSFFTFRTFSWPTDAGFLSKIFCLQWRKHQQYRFRRFAQQRNELHAVSCLYRRRRGLFQCSRYRLSDRSAEYSFFRKGGALHGSERFWHTQVHDRYWQQRKFLHNSQCGLYRIVSESNRAFWRQYFHGFTAGHRCL